MTATATAATTTVINFVSEYKKLYQIQFDCILIFNLLDGSFTKVLPKDLIEETPMESAVRISDQRFKSAFINWRHKFRHGEESFKDVVV